MFESLTKLMIVCCFCLFIDVRDACARLPSLSTAKESIVMPGGLEDSSNLRPCSQTSANWNVPFFQFMPLKTTPGDSCFQTAEMVTGSLPEQGHPDLSEHIASAPPLVPLPHPCKDSPGTLSMAVEKVWLADQGSHPRPGCSNRVIPDSMINKHRLKEVQTRELLAGDIHNCMGGSRVCSEGRYLRAETQSANSSHRKFIGQVAKRQREIFLQARKSCEGSLELKSSESTTQKLSLVKRNTLWDKKWKNFDKLPSALKTNLMKDYIFDTFQFDLEDKKLSKQSHPISISHRGHPVTYGPFYAFALAMERLKYFASPPTDEVYIIHLEDFLSKYLNLYCRTFLRRCGEVREMYIELKILAELYSQSGIVEARNISVLEAIDTFFSNEEEKLRDRSSIKCNKKISNSIEHSKDATLIFLQHIRATYELAKANNSKERMEEELTSLQKSGLNFAFEFWEKFDFRGTNTPHGKKETVSEAESSHLQDKHEVGICIHDTRAKRGKAGKKIKWSWELLKIFYESHQKPLAQLLFKETSIRKSAAGFVKHCIIAEFVMKEFEDRACKGGYQGTKVGF